MSTEVYLYLGFIGALISAKWALELRFSQLSQLIWAVFGFIAPPLALLILYVRLVRSPR